jgi:uncharacterized protein YdaU (DUF1376 family)
VKTQRKTSPKTMHKERLSRTVDKVVAVLHERIVYLEKRVNLLEVACADKLKEHKPERAPMIGFWAHGMEMMRQKRIDEEVEKIKEEAKRTQQMIDDHNAKEAMRIKKY